MASQAYVSLASGQTDRESFEIDAAHSGLSGLARPILFLHIPKTGGTSLLTMLSNVLGDRRIVRLRMEDPDLDARLGELMGGSLAGVDCITGHLPMALFEPHLDRLRPFTSLRNPIDRVLSIFRFLQRHTADELAAHGLPPGFGLDELIGTSNPGLFAQISNGMCRIIAGSPQSYDLSGADFWRLDGQHVLQAAANRLEHMDFGLMEDMQGTKMLMDDLLGTPTGLHEYHENCGAGPRTPVRTDQVRRLVAMNQADLTLYHGARALFASRLQALRDRAQDSAACGPRGVLRAHPGQELHIGDIPGRHGFHLHEGEGLAWIIAGMNGRVTFVSDAPSLRAQLRVYRVSDRYPVQEVTVRLNGDDTQFSMVAEDAHWCCLTTAEFPVVPGANVLELVAPFAVPARFVNPNSADTRALSIALGSLLFVS